MKKKYVFDPDSLRFVEYRLTPFAVLKNAIMRFASVFGILILMLLFMGSKVNNKIVRENDELRIENTRLKEERPKTPKCRASSADAQNKKMLLCK